MFARTAGTSTLAGLTLVAVQACGGDALSPGADGSVEPRYATEAASCTRGDVEALFQAPLVAFDLYFGLGTTNPLAANVLTCQYRLFLPTYPDGSPITFHEGEPFLGGVVFFEPFDSELGLQFSDDIEVRVWLTEVTESGPGEPVEQTVLESPVKLHDVPGVGLAVAKQWGIITALPAGEYVSTTVASFNGEPEDPWIVHVFIE